MEVIARSIPIISLSLSISLNHNRPISVTNISLLRSHVRFMTVRDVKRNAANIIRGVKAYRATETSTVQ